MAYVRKISLGGSFDLQPKELDPRIATASLEQRCGLALWIAKRTVFAEDGCWYLSTRTDRDKQQTVMLNGATFNVSQAAFFLRYGYLPPQVCHTCDHPACFRWSHLFAGNNSLNMRDAYAKGRAVHPINPNATANLPPPRRGEANPANKLTTAQVQEIKRRSAESPTVLGREFGVRRETIRDIFRGRIWRHV